MKKQLIDRLNNLKNRTDRDYEFSGESQRSYDKWQIDILEEIISTIESQWIDVKDRLPDEEWLYLAITAKWRDVVVASLWAVNQKSYDTTTMISYYTYTHWKPIWDLPLPPNK